MNRSRNWWLVFFCLFCTLPLHVFAQDEVAVKGYTLDERGKPIGNVKISIDKMRITSTTNGVFQVYLKKGTVPANVIANKEGLSLKTWQYDEANHTLNITMHAKQSTLRGEVRNRFNEHISNVYVAIKGVNESSPAKSNTEGKFSINLPDNFNPELQATFLIDGLVVEAKDVTFKDNNHYVILVKPKTPKEIAQQAEEEKQNLVLGTTVKMKAKVANNNANAQEKPQPTEWNYQEDFKKITAELEEQSKMVAESNEKLRKDLLNITDKLKIDENKARSAGIKEEVNSLEQKLAENNRVYQESQQKTYEVIEKLKQELLERDSVTLATKEALQTVTKEKEEAEQRFQRNILIASALIIFLLALSVIFYFISRRIQKQNRQIFQQAQELTNAYQEIKVKNETLEVQKVIIEKKNANITASINYAQRIQKAMLPSQQDIQNLLLESFLFFKPRDVVSGDFYWIAEVADGFGNKKIVLAAIDCTGHGVPGAFMSMVGDGLLNQIVKLQQITSPDLILKALDKGVKESLNQEETANNDGMDIAICTIDKNSKKMEFAGAKNPLVYIQDGEIVEIAGDKLHVGGSIRKNIERFKNKQFTKHTIDLSLPTTCYIFSDGYEDQFGGTENKKFGKRQLYQKFIEYHQLPMEEQKLALEQNFKAWMGKHAQIDDILVIGFRV